VGLSKNDDEWKTPKTIVNSIATCAQQGGNYLLNIGPMADGTVPEPSVRILGQVGAWLDVNGQAIYATDGCASISFGNYDNFTRKGNTLYVHVYFWPSGTPAAEWLPFFQPPTVVAIGGMQCKVLSAKVLKTGQPVKVTQSDISVRLTGLPEMPPDDLVTVLCSSATSHRWSIII
jgi:alpha-L-fucosidase